MNDGPYEGYISKWELKSRLKDSLRCAFEDLRNYVTCIFLGEEKMNAINKGIRDKEAEKTQKAYNRSSFFEKTPVGPVEYNFNYIPNDEAKEAIDLKQVRYLE